MVSNIRRVLDLLFFFLVRTSRENFDKILIECWLHF